ncbi:type II toxin-antitoxin system RelE/ParE family toxin [Aquibium oceanicum]|uniref:Uncharacterized protein n=1 Tax=Aquibium oceanicum TaxID=1670800 RepID=A0A1L3SWK4_9HYPH|nr:type II toxin-antitoxin system mRNA interferase toxin, RelE/StbE family [Aquibium oceanicum]APH73702.1 hypothetical protein BSQ44_21685 [Aquibium oceanicum]
MSFLVLFSRESEQDLANIVDYIARDNPHRAHTFVDELRAHVEEKLSTYPASGPPIGIRRYVVFGNYIIVYRVEESEKIVHVQVIVEGHRNWRRAFENPA